MAVANGKIILLGEHAVVYGVPAIAAGLPEGAKAHAQPSPTTELFISQRGVGARSGNDRHISVDNGNAEGKALHALLQTLGVSHVRIDAELRIPSGMGLGASAALGVAIARAALALRDGHAPPPQADESTASHTPSHEQDAEVLAAAEAWERVFHGNPSGIDSAAACRGGCLRFSKDRGAEAIPVGAPLTFAVALAGPAASTKAMVDLVAGMKERKPALVEKTLSGIHSLVNNAALCIEAGDIHGLGKLLDLNQMLLAGLFLSTPEIELACQSAREAGALGAKLTGSGGGGAVIALVTPETAPAVQGTWRARGFESFLTEVK